MFKKVTIQRTGQSDKKIPPSSIYRKTGQGLKTTKDRTQTPPPTLILPSPQHTVSPCPPTTQWPTLCNTSFFCPGVPILGPNAPPPTIWVTKAIRFLSHGDWLKATVLPQSCGNLEYIIPIQIYLLSGLNKNYRRPLFGCKLQHNPD